MTDLNDIIALLRDFQEDSQLPNDVRRGCSNAADEIVRLIVLNGEISLNALDRIEEHRKALKTSDAVVEAARGLVTRDDFWSGDFATPGEFDDVVDALDAHDKATE